MHTVGEDDGGGSYCSFNCQIASNDFTTRNFFSLQSKMHFSLVSRLIFSYCCFCKKVNCVFFLCCCIFRVDVAFTHKQIMRFKLLKVTFWEMFSSKSWHSNHWRFLLRKLRLMLEKKRVSYFVSYILNMEKGESLVNQFIRVDLWHLWVQPLKKVGWVFPYMLRSLTLYCNFIQHTTQFAYDFRPLLCRDMQINLCSFINAI